MRRRGRRHPDCGFRRLPFANDGRCSFAKRQQTSLVGRGHRAPPCDCYAPPFGSTGRGLALRAGYPRKIAKSCLLAPRVLRDARRTWGGRAGSGSDCQRPGGRRRGQAGRDDQSL